MVQMTHNAPPANHSFNNKIDTIIVQKSLIRAIVKAKNVDWAESVSRNWDALNWKKSFDLLVNFVQGSTLMINFFQSRSLSLSSLLESNDEVNILSRKWGFIVASNPSNSKLYISWGKRKQQATDLQTE